MKWYLIPSLLFLCLPAKSQAKLNFGIEIDALPYITGGWFAAGWAGKDVWRVRMLATSVHKPDWSTKKGFYNHDILSYAIVIDRFMQADWKGWWAGGGLVYWKSNISADQSKASFSNYLFNGSLGCNFKIGRHFYLSPWAGLSFKMAGDTDVPVGTKTYNLPSINPEASLKAGFIF